jgi:hypothetical protein
LQACLRTCAIADVERGTYRLQHLAATIFRVTDRTNQAIPHPGAALCWVTLNEDAGRSCCTPQGMLREFLRAGLRDPDSVADEGALI